MHLHPAAEEIARATTSVAPEETVRPAEASAAEPEVNEPIPSAPPAPTSSPILSSASDMKKTDHFVWNDAANQAFEDLKKQLAEPPVLASPVDKEPLLLYVAANSRAISVAIVVERQEAGKV